MSSLCRRFLVPYVSGAATALVAVLLAGVPAPRPAPRLERAPTPPAEASAPAAEERFSYAPLDPTGELLEPIPESVEEFFEDHLEIDFVPARIELGRRFFHDPRLSKDDSLSCASCHDLRYAGIDRAVTATGFRGQLGGLNAPSVYNAAFHLGQFWDGRARDLETQADGPPNAPGEMASNWDEIAAKLEADARTMDLFRHAFPDLGPEERIAAEHVTSAIADYERTLITPNAPFDRYLRGEDGAVDERVKEGYQLFKDLGCVECHHGMAVGGASYQRLGRAKEYFASDGTTHDLGRLNVTGNPDDRHVFKVGSLRNVALTAPYLHDGSIATLDGVVRVMGEFQLGVSLTDAQVERLVAFLESLTGEHGGRPLGSLQNTLAHPASPHDE